MYIGHPVCYYYIFFIYLILTLTLFGFLGFLFLERIPSFFLDGGRFIWTETSNYDLFEKRIFMRFFLNKKFFLGIKKSNKHVILKSKEIEFLPQTQITISLQPDGVNRWYFKIRLFDLTEFIVWNIKCLQHQVAKI